MAPKNAEKIMKNLPMSSSSEEEDEESGSLSGEEESDTCGEESEKEESHVTPIASKKPEANADEAEHSKKKMKGQNTHVTKDKPENSVASSSEEEDEESGSLSGEEESDTCGEESEKEESHVTPIASKKPEANADEAEHSKKKMKVQITHVTKDRPESEEEDEESGSLSGEEESDTCGEESQKEESHVTPIAATKIPEPNSEEAEPSKKKMKGQSTHVTKDRPESSVAKRSLENANGNVQKNNKKLKSQTIEHEATKEEVKKTPLFTRIFTHRDEINLLRGILEFTSKRGDPYENTDRFCAKMQKKMSFNASQSQLMNKIQRLKSKFERHVKKSLVKGRPIVFSKVVDDEIFELSRKIWGNGGVLASKAKKKLGGIKQETNVVSTPSSSGNEILSFLEKENVLSGSLDESTVMAWLDMVKDEQEKKTMEEKAKTINATRVELSLQKNQFVAKVINAMFGDIPSSSSK